MRGNVVDLAVAVVVGGAFGAVVKALVADLLTPLIAAIGGQHNFSQMSFTVHHSTFMYGDFINAVVAFISIAVVVFFFVVHPLNKLVELSKRNKKPEDPTVKKCPHCWSDIPVQATRCPFCTSKIAAAKK